MIHKLNIHEDSEPGYSQRSVLGAGYFTFCGDEVGEWTKHRRDKGFKDDPD